MFWRGQQGGRTRDGGWGAALGREGGEGEWLVRQVNVRLGRRRRILVVAVVVCWPEISFSPNLSRSEDQAPLDSL